MASMGDRLQRDSCATPSSDTAVIILRIRQLVQDLYTSVATVLCNFGDGEQNRVSGWAGGGFRSKCSRESI